MCHGVKFNYSSEIFFYWSCTVAYEAKPQRYNLAVNGFRLMKCSLANLAEEQPDGWGQGTTKWLLMVTRWTRTGITHYTALPIYRCHAANLPAGQLVNSGLHTQWQSKWIININNNNNFIVILVNYNHSFFTALHSVANRHIYVQLLQLITPADLMINGFSISKRFSSCCFKELNYCTF